MTRIPSGTWVRGPWGPSIARRPCPQRVPAVCMCFGACIVSIFSCSASATLAGRALFLCPDAALTLTLFHFSIKQILRYWLSLFAFNHFISCQSFQSGTYLEMPCIQIRYFWSKNPTNLCVMLHFQHTNDVSAAICR
ncbi:hypothetical protein HETIRDRAFT_47915 [Heterobasidion irregulare TC 32-1]|uniref:Uncharacterized protein n=1 Tax=Heterobasidion irregulare (strain TC 32-1) TaxID=747525 RepID=W4KCU5_HETIT|nr:uncharacterized protein HETIRDRAFT_47915 [Heterobasidion irregulare TC 32-1]ETW83682.1 hypothetical protein HETIRDRAFT_47915 [Heterobasidion irregulare TC 32-1]